MRALTHDTFGDPAEVLTVTEVADAGEPGPGQVRLRIVRATIHNHDLWTVRGTYGFKPDLPGARSGTEALGVVEALGEGVTHLSVGQRVVAGGVFGVWAEQVLAPAAALLPVPDSIEDGAAAQLVSMPFSAVSLLDFTGLEAGGWLIQNAANGAVGRLVVQFARARGINVVSLVRREAGEQELADAGIDRVVSTDRADWRDRVEAITGGAPITVAVDSVGGQAAADLLGVLAVDGTLISFGAMNDGVMLIPSGDVIFKQATVKGFWGSAVSKAMAPERRTALLREVVERVASGEVTLGVEETFPLEKAADAVAAHFRPGRVGKIQLVP
ncbi:zinc-binding dehydrogenase [Nocardioides fonticola]|uniref:Zinc-binding dehydrogenase n=1 Tax=Nocardioides fonticola TaxID=450363 RepID=A0ABP7Y2Z1_9ACTN